MSRFVNPVPQYWLDDGDIASAGRFYFYENKNYAALKATYSRPDNTVPNTNPLILDGQGRIPACFGEGLYSVKFYAANPENPSSDGALQWTRDDVSLSELTGQWELWNAAETYEVGEFAKDPTDGNYYQLWGSPTSKGEQPSATLTKWEPVYFLKGFNTNKTYNEDDIVVDGGFIYRSLEDDNGDTPPSAKWANLTFNDSIAGNFLVGGVLSATGTPEFNSGKIQIGLDAGPKRLIRSDGKISSDDATYTDIATRKSVRVALGGAFDASQYIVLEKIGNTVTITSVGIISHTSGSSAQSSAVIPSEYRLGQDLGLEISYGYGHTTLGFLIKIDITQAGTVRVSYCDYAGAAVSRTDTSVPFSVSYTIVDATP